MAEEVLKYRVEIDQADLGSQIENIKNRIDMALGSFAFSQEFPTTTERPLVNLAANAFSASSRFGAAFHDTFGEMGEILSGGMRVANLGYQKFRGDLQMAGLISPPEYAYQTSLGDIQLEDLGLKTKGFFGSSLSAKFGKGYNPEMPLTREEYRSLYAESSGEKLIDAASGVLGWGGLGASLLAPGVGHLLGGAALATWGTYKLAKLGGYEYDATNVFGEFLERTSFRNLRQLDKTSARDVAKYIRNLSEDVVTRSDIGDATAVQDLVTEGVTAGLFLDTSNAEEFKIKAKELVDNFRTIQHTMKTTSEEAISIIKDLSMSGMATDINEIKNMSLTARVVGNRTGYTPIEMLQIAQKGAEMVRGTGISMYQAGMQVMRLTEEIRAGYGTVYDDEIIRQMGGSSQAALQLARLGYTMGNSVQGRIGVAAQLSGYQFGTGGGFSDMFGAIAGNMPTTPEEFLLFKSRMREEQKQATFGERSLRQAEIDFAQMKQMGINVNTDTYTQFLIENGFTEQEANLQAGYALANPNERITRILGNEYKKMNQAGKESRSLFNLYKSRIGTEIRDWWQNTGGLVSEGVLRGVENLEDYYQTFIGNELTEENIKTRDQIFDVRKYEKNKREMQEFQDKNIPNKNLNSGKDFRNYFLNEVKQGRLKKEDLNDAMLEAEIKQKQQQIEIDEIQNKPTTDALYDLGRKRDAIALTKIQVALENEMELRGENAVNYTREDIKNINFREAQNIRNFGTFKGTVLSQDTKKSVSDRLFTYEGSIQDQAVMAQQMEEKLSIQKEALWEKFHKNKLAYTGGDYSFFGTVFGIGEYGKYQKALANEVVYDIKGLKDSFKQDKEMSNILNIVSLGYIKKGEFIDTIFDEYVYQTGGNQFSSAITKFNNELKALGVSTHEDEEQILAGKIIGNLNLEQAQNAYTILKIRNTFENIIASDEVARAKNIMGAFQKQNKESGIETFNKFKEFFGNEAELLSGLEDEQKALLGRIVNLHAEDENFNRISLKNIKPLIRDIKSGTAFNTLQENYKTGIYGNLENEIVKGDYSRSGIENLEGEEIARQQLSTTEQIKEFLKRRFSIPAMHSEYSDNTSVAY